MSHHTQLDPLTFPLQGSALIEASAGTGKTFTLTLLYLRLILQQPDFHLGQRALLPPDILVVTFTKAATQELRDRIRQRLVNMAQVLQAPDPEALTQHSLLLDLRRKLIEAGAAQQQSAEQTCAQAAHQLELAAQWMDEAAILTIHSWCYRMLKEHAFHSGHLLQHTLIENEQDWLEQATEDYWRHFYLPLHHKALSQVLIYFASPADTCQQVQSLIHHLDALPPQADPPDVLIAQIEQDKQQLLKQLKTCWQDVHLPALIALFEQAKKQKAYNARALNARHTQAIYDRLYAWIHSPVVAPEIEYEQSSFQRLALLDTSIWFDQQAIPWQHPACQALASLPEQLDALPSPYAGLLNHAVHWIAQHLQHTKQQHNLISHQDLLQQLDHALHGPQGEQLAATLRQQYPVALIDEFQDTDPLQYRIFDRIYSIHDPHPHTTLLMIGDPKQAIYSFRGADIYTYLTAQQATQGHHYTLEYNYRSSRQLIEAVNRLFMLGTARSQGAFLMPSLPFHPVHAGKRSESWLERHGTRVAPMTSWLITAEDSAKITQKHYAERTSQQTAALIAHLLDEAQHGQAWLVEAQPDGVAPQRRALEAADIAILVNQATEAQAVRQALSALGIASVYLSEQNSVYQSDAAKALLPLLSAVAEPHHGARLRTALALPQLGLSLATLDAFHQDEWRWEEQVQAFVDYHRYWRHHGCLALIHRLIQDFSIAARLLQQPGGERELTDWLHLAELLQQAALELEGEQALLRYLQEQHQSTQQVSEAQQLRLESDRRLVQIVTIHKAKGLEYPLVVLPFATSCRPIGAKMLPLKTHDAQGRLQLHLQASPENLAQADEERLAEDLRKLYVALTRASHSQWLGLGATTNSPKSALGYLLDLRAPDQLLPAVEAAQLGIMPLLTEAPAQRPTPAPRFKPLRKLKSGLIQAWWVASYSALRFAYAPSGSRAETPIPSKSQAAIEQQALFEQQAIFEQQQQQEQETATQQQTDEETRIHTLPSSVTGLVEVASPALAHQPINAATVLHHFPAGATWGTLLHTLLEWAATQEHQDVQGQRSLGFAAINAHNTASQAHFYALCQRRQVPTELLAPLWQWLIDFIHTPWRLDQLGVTSDLALCRLSPQQLAIEMEFMFESHHVPLAILDRLICTHTLAGAPRPSVATSWLNGLFKGFIDLVVEHQGRYYVIDWKSNCLGREDEAYTLTAMRQQMLAHRYDFQYVLYLVALQRLLKARLPDYSYERHIGGAIYVFLRGTRHTTQGLVCDKPPQTLIDQLDDYFSQRRPHLSSTQPREAIP